jgi:Ser/Thr protein kinase RdoA (MazF antagonist)
MDEKRAMFDRLARCAVQCYAIAPKEITFLRHGDSVAYKVSCADGAYLLRLHVPVTAALGSHGADPTMVESELVWLEALAKTTPLLLAVPQRNVDGGLLTQVPAGPGADANASLLRWVDGEPYHRDLETEDTAAQIGETLATLHHQAQAWTLPEGFRRPTRDAAHFERHLLALRPAVEDGRIRAVDYDQLAQSVAWLSDYLGVPRARSQGIQHADPHKGNLLLDRGRIRLIDFSFCGFGDFLLDLGVALSDMKPELHRACLDGYRKVLPLPDDYARTIQGLSLGTIVGTFSFWEANPRAQDLLRTKVPVISATYAVPFNRGDDFWHL